jgi:ACS family D-galactonate transporter-like MFS transporter
MRANDRNRAWIVVVLLFMFMVINFADKAVIGIAAVPIMQELELGLRQFGLVGSSFFLLFAVSSVATGFLVNRVQTRWVLLAMGFIWALPVSGDRCRNGPAPGGTRRGGCPSE